MTRSDLKSRIEHEDCRHMALALEGISGALHQGRPVEVKDLASASKAAGWVWEAGPEPDAPQAREFEAAHEQFEKASSACAQGAAHESAIVERSAQTLARQLRWMAQAQQEARKELPSAASNSITELTKKYGRYGVRPLAA